MNLYLLAAGSLTLVVGLVHSVLGEILIFRRLGAGPVIADDGRKVLGRQHVRILRATWHVASVLGASLAVLLLRLALPGGGTDLGAVLETAAAGAFLVSGFLVLAGTRGKHPGWAAFFVIVGLILFA